MFFHCTHLVVNLLHPRLPVFLIVGYMDIRLRLGLRIKELREDRGYTQRRFAEASGIDRSYLAAIEVGSINVGIKNIERMAKELGITVGELMEGL